MAVQPANSYSFDKNQDLIYFKIKPRTLSITKLSEVTALSNNYLALLDNKARVIQFVLHYLSSALCYQVNNTVPSLGSIKI